MKDRTNIFKKFITSIYDLKVFSKYAKDGLSKAILYALFMTFIIGGINGIFIGYRLNEGISRINNELKSDEYQYSIKNGELRINKSPIKFEEENILIYIDKDILMDEDDTLRKITVHKDFNILILKDGIVINNLIDKYEIPYNNLIIESSLSINNFNLLKILILIISCITVSIITFFELIINSLIVVAIASIITIFMKMVVKYSALYSITLYAATLPLIIKIVLEIINPNVDLNTVFIIGTLTYVILILNYIKSELIEKIKQEKIK